LGYDKKHAPKILNEMKHISILVLLSFSAFVTGNAQDLKTEAFSVAVNKTSHLEKLPLVADTPIKNVIFVIGDGTGLAQLYSGQLHLAGVEGLLYVQTMPVTGYSRTASASSLITDSAAGATAYSCGIKTDNGVIAQTPDGRACRTILEMAEDLGKSTGIIASSTITHATPASYASHVESRAMQAQIAEQYLGKGMEIILGGGLGYFIPKDQEGSSREDDLNLISKFENAGYQFVSNAVDLAASDSEFILGLFSDGGMPSESRSPSLAEMTTKALEVLSTDENGFFLAVEGSQIDWAGHGNDIEYMMREIRDFDAAIKEILEFAVADGETLVIVTADHETGGLTMQQSENFEEMTVAWTTGYHTGIPVPVMAYGPYATEFTGWLENTEIGIKVAELAGLGKLPFIIED
jgi:alkaline phosphatase